jgi:hypothetical protein
MSAGQFAGRVAIVLLALGMGSAGCANGTTEMTGRRDGSIGEAGTMDTGVRPDTGTADADDSSTAPDANTDAWRLTVGTCEACTVDADCGMDAFCAMLVMGGRACLPRCDMEFPSCPRNFTCIFDATGTGVHANVCAPVGGPCCVDEDEDDYGVGVGCLGADCNDTSGVVHPDRTEICDGIDTNCNGSVDEPPTDCETGVCNADGDGTFTGIVAGTCVGAMCGSGTTLDCALFTCDGVGGGDAGDHCATTCAPMGADDDDFCIAAAHCETGVCVADIVPGMACDEDSDCGTAHCDNGFCCGMGTCCSVVADCPGGGTLTHLCDDPANCQGSRGETQCNASFTCETMMGIADDSGCTDTTLAHDCGLLRPVLCNGSEVQTPRACPTSCLTDGDCIDLAHCSVGFCVPDLPPGGPCGRPQDCQMGLSCVDSTCCTTACAGSCEACNLPGSAGTCTPIPAGADPAGECAAIPCGGFYDGFSGGSDVCYRRADVSDAAAVCNGARACVDADILCPTQPRGTAQIDCNDMCQAPTGGTCTGTTPGSCRNLDDPSVRTTCGAGACMGDVQRCVGGSPAMCTMGTPMAEICNGVDDDCMSGVDNGPLSSLCPSPPQVSGVMCNGISLCSLTGCNPGFGDVDHVYTNGCECTMGLGGTNCASAYSVGSITAGVTRPFTGALLPGGSSWFSADFGTAPAGSPAPGRPRISVSPASDFRINVMRGTCGGAALTCRTEGGSSATTTDFEFYDMSGSGESWASRGVPWVGVVYVQVTRTSSPANCAQATFTVTFQR